MPDVFGLPQDKAANTASRLASRYDANTAWSSLDASSPWQFGGDMREQYIKHIPRRGRNQISVDIDDIIIDRTPSTPVRFNVPESMGPMEVMNMAKNLPQGVQNLVLAPVQNLAGKFMIGGFNS
jgi:hypothetical protein